MPPQVQPQQPPQQAMKKYDGKNGQPLYNATNQGHYGASSAIVTAGHAPPQDLFQGQYSNVGQGLQQPYRDIMNTYWQNQITGLETEEHDFKLHQLPLARIKKVMKADPEVKMISAEAPIMFAKGCDIFITELTMRAWIHAEENKRRTLQRSDIATALTKSDMFDFLIDIVPRDEATTANKRKPEFTPGGTYAVPDASMDPNAGMQAAPGQPGQAPMGHEFAQMPQHMPPEAQYPAQTGMYPPPGPQGAYQAPQMFDPSMYATNYAMTQQPVSIPSTRQKCQY
ncbi:histone-fold-containing protein [Myriangium duriaei CBS 260.36]|uniref:Histone-fold-containing protein n=1 Tax=Myriangium duriaei CBS 260.36 TaxID=1168546 RepID=A0A9P4MIK8_9PEZI|nr:histone-fold-containing protein [Myriangium duriaei CBS 260.36]